jgi:hypothetical protein
MLSTGIDGRKKPSFSYSNVKIGIGGFDAVLLRAEDD